MSDTISSLLNFASNLKLGVWALNLQPASWRGNRFAVRTSSIRRGRRVVVHEYPYTDLVWVEDLGRGTRIINFTGFLVGDDVFAQRDKMIAAAEAKNTGTLVHPSLGKIQVSLTEFSAGERADLGRVVELEFSFIESSQQPAFPKPSGLAGFLKTAATLIQTISATASEYIGDVQTAIAGVQAGLTYASNVFATVRGLFGLFGNIAGTVASDAGMLVNTVSGLQGADFGRYTGNRAILQPATATVASLIALATTNQGAVTQAASGLASIVDPTLLPAATMTLTEAVRATAQDPRDQIRILTPLAAFTPPQDLPSLAPIGATVLRVQLLTISLLRISALISIANATMDYTPSSYDDAIAVLIAVTAQFDSEILNAADLGLTASYLALRATRAAVTDDLLGRAATLPRLTTVTSPAPMPSLALAYRLYGDATRSDELITRANPISPLFMPLSFRALSS